MGQGFPGGHAQRPPRPQQLEAGGGRGPESLRTPARGGQAGKRSWVGVVRGVQRPERRSRRRSKPALQGLGTGEWAQRGGNRKALQRGGLVQREGRGAGVRPRGGRSFWWPVEQRDRGLKVYGIASQMSQPNHQ